MKNYLVLITFAILIAAGMLSAEQKNKNECNQIQADPKPIVFFNNILDSTGFQDNFYFHNAYWRFINGEYGTDIYKDMTEQMAFNNVTVPKIKINDHQVYVFPLGDKGLDYSPGSITLFKFIKAALDSGKRVIIFGNGFLEKTTDPEIKKFIDSTMGIMDIGRKIVSSKDSVFPYGIKGKDETDIGLNDYITCNAIGYDNGTPYQALMDYRYLNTFKSRDEEKFTTFFHIAKEENNVMVATDSAVGIRTKLKKGARVVLWSIGSENVHFTHRSQRIIHSSLQWALMNDVDMNAPELDIIPGFSVDMGFGEQGTTRIKTIRLRNKGKDTLHISKVEFENRDKGEIFPVDSIGQNAETYYKTKKFVLKPNSIDSIRVCFKPKEDGSIYLRTISLHTNEQALDTSAYGRKRDITFIGQGGKDDYTGAYIQANIDFINFDSVSLKNSGKKLLEIHNKGTDTIRMSSIKLVPQDSIYKINNIDLKRFTLAPHTFNTYEIEFTPYHLIDYIAEIQVWSDASNSSEEGYIKILLFGRGAEAPGFVPEVIIPGCSFSLTAAPNPANDIASVIYMYEGDQIACLKLWLADIRGKKVIDILNKSIEPGEGNVSFNTTGLASGTYFIIADMQGKSAKIPLVIIR